MSGAPTSTDQVRIRRHARDLEALVELEQGFPATAQPACRASSARQCRDLGGRVPGRGGDAVVLFRHGFDGTRLYSMVVDWLPRPRRAQMLLDAAEEGARERRW